MSFYRRTMKRHRSIVPMLFLLLLHPGLPGTIHAAAGVTLMGKIVDSDGAALPDATVTIRGAGFDQTFVTDKKGRFKAKLPDAKAENSLQALYALNAGVKANNDGDLELALREFDKAVIEDPDFAQAQLAIASIHEARGDYEQALAPPD